MVEMVVMRGNLSRLTKELPLLSKIQTLWYCGLGWLTEVGKEDAKSVYGGVGHQGKYRGSIA